MYVNQKASATMYINPKKIKDAKIKKNHLDVINDENLKARHLPIYKGLPFTDAKARTRFPICKDVAQEK